VADERDELEHDTEDIEGARTGRIAFATIEPMTLTASTVPAEALERALVPGTQIERHGRVWYMGQHRREGASIIGRIGFQTSDFAEVWDADRKDFAEEQLLSGLTSPFAIDPTRLRVAFQLRPGLIRVKSFTGALQALMNEASPADRWRVYQEVESVTFNEWVESVDRVLTLRVRVKRPNPHYDDRENVEQLIEGANARMADIVWSADQEALDGLDVGDAFIREAIAHAETYGSYVATGEQDDKPTTWGSDQEAAAEKRTVEADPRTREITGTNLRRQLGDDTPEGGDERRGGDRRKGDG
jgi:hypothetical protein